MMIRFNKKDQSYMLTALTLATRGRGRTSPNPMVGAVIVKDDKVVGRGFHARAGEAHAEIEALRDAGELAVGATLYVTLEPCVHQGRTPPCVDAIVESGIERVVAAMEDPNPRMRGRGVERLRAAGIQTEVGCLEAQARELNEAFVVFQTEGRPFVTIKWAMSLCGRTAHDSGQSRWISGPRAREQGHRLRSRHDAVMVGIGTVLTDDPMLNVRLRDYDGPQPRRIVIDGDLSLPTRARLLREREKGEVILFTTGNAKRERIELFEREGCRVIVMPGQRRIIDLKFLMTELHKLNVISVLCEGGRQVHTALMHAGLVDKLVAFISPRIIGGWQLRNPIEGLDIPFIDRAIELRDVKTQTFGKDIMIEGYLRRI